MFSIIIASAAVATTTAASSSECNYKGVSSKRRRQPPRPRPLQANNYLLAYLFMVLLIIEQRRKKTKKKLCPLPQLSSPPPSSSVFRQPLWAIFSEKRRQNVVCQRTAAAAAVVQEQCTQTVSPLTDTTSVSIYYVRLQIKLIRLTLKLAPAHWTKAATASAAVQVYVSDCLCLFWLVGWCAQQMNLFPFTLVWPLLLLFSSLSTLCLQPQIAVVLLHFIGPCFLQQLHD